jgi:hypothetical protein
VLTVSTIVATSSVVVGVAFTIFEIRHMAKTRRTDVIMRIYERFSNKEWVENTMKVTAAKFENFDDYRRRYGFTEVIQVATLFDGVGVLLQQNLIDANLVHSLFGTSVKLMWEKTRPVIYGIRETGGVTSMFSNFQYLYERLGAYDEETGEVAESGTTKN